MQRLFRGLSEAGSWPPANASHTVSSALNLRSGSTASSRVILSPICLAIDRKARKPVVNGLQLRFVRFSGKGLAQGVVNMRIGSEPIRV